MEISIIMQLISPAITFAIDASLWMVEHWYIAGPVLLIEYLVLMELWQAAKGRWWEKPMMVVGGIIFIPQDVIVNILASVLFLDPPSRWLVTDRMQRYKADGGWGKWINWYWLRLWRFNFAHWLCRLLNPAQQKLTGDDHC